MIDSEVKAIIDDCYEKAESLIREHQDILYKAADLLMEKEKITGEEFEALFEEVTKEIATVTPAEASEEVTE